MTRQQQNVFITQKITEKLGDQPNVQENIAKSFEAWFQQLVVAGAQMLSPQQGAENGSEDTISQSPQPAG